MRNQRNTFLAGVAALALLAGTGFASAQESPKDAGGTAGAQAQPDGKNQKTGQSTQEGKMGETERANQKKCQSTQEGKMGETECAEPKR
jgi:hypothetical protein